jgi:S1-C subfamily serine protease
MDWLLVSWLQINIVGKAESDYLPGVQVPQVIAESAAEKAGLKPGDLILRVGDYEVKAAADQVGELCRKSS